jgi:thiamine-monophosphate kinase
MQPNIPQLTVADVGEFGLIDRLATALGPPTNEALVVGIGDDAAAWKPASRCLTVATTDTLVEGIHFNLATTEWEDLGWKALAENISDVAAMGCNPRYALIALGVPAKQAVADLESFYRGMRACGARFGCSVVGGDMVRGNQLTIQVTVIGESLTIRSEADRPAGCKC